MKVCPYRGYRGEMDDVGDYIFSLRCPECGKEFNEDEN